jgi:hypothetical protein
MRVVSADCGNIACGPGWFFNSLLIKINFVPQLC